MARHSRSRNILATLTALGLMGSCGQKYDIGLNQLEAMDEEFKVGAFSGKVDVLFVIDNSGSMAEEIGNVKSSIAKFIDGFLASDVDYQIGVISTDGLPYGEHWTKNSWAKHDNFGPSSLVSKPGRPRILTRSMNKDAVAADLSFAVDLPISGSGAEAGLYTTTGFLTDPRVADWNKGFVREDALFGLVIVSDEDESLSPLENGEPQLYLRSDPEKRRERVDSFVSAMKQLKPKRPDLLSYNAVIGPSVAECSTLEKEGEERGTGDVYMEAAELLGGRVLNICQDFSDELGSLSQKIAAQPGRRFGLMGKVAQPDSIKVFIDGVELARSDRNGFSYESKGNAIELHGDLGGKTAYTVKVTYSSTKRVE